MWHSVGDRRLIVRGRVDVAARRRGRPLPGRRCRPTRRRQARAAPSPRVRTDAGAPALDSADQVRTRWEEVKAQERDGKPTPKTLLSGVPDGLPALFEGLPNRRPRRLGWLRLAVRARCRRQGSRRRSTKYETPSSAATPHVQTGRRSQSGQTRPSKKEIGDPALRHREPGAHRRRRARDGTAEGQRKFRSALHPDMEARIAGSGRRFRDTDAR